MANYFLRPEGCDLNWISVQLPSGSKQASKSFPISELDILRGNRQKKPLIPQNWEKGYGEGDPILKTLGPIS